MMKTSPSETRSKMEKKSAAIIYWSKTGNTEKAATTIRDGLEEAGWEVVPFLQPIIG